MALTDWQEWAVAAVGAVVAVLILRRAICFVLGRGGDGCASCGKKGCPMRKNRCDREK